MLRRMLDGLYRLSGATSAAFLVLICLLVTVQVILNLITKVFGASVALTIPSYAEFAGFFLAAASFLALAYTLTRGGHIRVTLVVQYLPEKLQVLLEVFAFGLCALTSAYVTFYMGKLTYDSYRFSDMSPGIVAVPIWIPQLSLLLGLVILTIALLDMMVRTIVTRKVVLVSVGHGD